MINLYTNDGWINSDLIVHNKSTFVLVIGGRGIGKSYGVLKQLYEEKINFIYMRRTQSQLDAVTVPALSPYNQINTDCGYKIRTGKTSKYTIGFYDDEPEPFALGIALSTFASVRGLSAERYDVLLFDEIIPERHEKKIKEEELAFANALESLNRNRELNGREALKVIMLSNSNTLNSRIISAIGCTDVLDRMSRKGQVYKEVNNGDVTIIRYEDSPISKRKADTALYRVIKNNDFQSMALDNEFSAADYELVASRPLQEYNMVVSIGECTVCKHKTNRDYYVIAGAKAQKQYSLLPIDRASFQKQYFYLYAAMVQKRISFQSATVKLEFERGWEK